MSSFISQILNRLGLGDGSLNLEQNSRRRFIRHPAKETEVELGNQAFNVQDWSLGGLSFDGDAGHVNAGDSLTCTIRFRFPNETITITQPARVVRKARKGVAAAFDYMSDENRRQFQRVLDSYHAQGFIESQVA